VRVRRHWRGEEGGLKVRVKEGGRMRVRMGEAR